jgi:S1-C subfamily serine protease
VSDVRIIADRTTSGVRITVDPKSAAGASPEGNSVAVTLGETGGPDREVVIADVAAGSEAERAGLRPGDVLLSVDGVKVERIEDARAKLTGPAALDVLLKLRRGDRFDLRRVPREPTRR